MRITLIILSIFLFTGIKAQYYPNILNAKSISYTSGSATDRDVTSKKTETYHIDPFRPVNLTFDFCFTIDSISGTPKFKVAVDRSSDGEQYHAINEVEVTPTFDENDQWDTCLTRTTPTPYWFLRPRVTLIDNTQEIDINCDGVVGRGYR
jgi:hypothetical protein